MDGLVYAIPEWLLAILYITGEDDVNNQLRIGDQWVIQSRLKGLEIVQVMKIKGDAVTALHLQGTRDFIGNTINLSATNTQWLSLVDHVEKQHWFKRFINFIFGI